MSRERLVSFRVAHSAAAFLFVVGGLFGAALGSVTTYLSSAAAMSKLRGEAIDRGFARWEANADGKHTFIWADPPAEAKR